MTRRWLVSPAFDLAFFVGPSLAALALVALWPAARATGDRVPIGAWVACVLLVDVAHVWSTLARTYLDPMVRGARATLLATAPAVCLLAGVLAYALSPALFWRALAYLAVWHFIRQQYGFVALYGRLGGWPAKIDATIDRWAIHAATLYPLVWWHTHLPRPFVWFTPGDFVALPAFLEPVARAVWVAALSAFALRQLVLAWRGVPLCAGRIAIVASTAAVWYVGIVALASDLAFTVTNCVAHGVPYLALVWIANHRRWRQQPAAGPRAPLLAALARPLLAPAFLALWAALAFGEELIWDQLVWHERAALFGAPAEALRWIADSDLLAVLVPLLALPQATHYVLDAYIWKLDGSNDGLEAELFGRP